MLDVCTVSIHISYIHVVYKYIYIYIIYSIFPFYILYHIKYRYNLLILYMILNIHIIQCNYCIIYVYHYIKHNIYIYISYFIIYTLYRQNQLLIFGAKYSLSLFLGGLSLYSLLFKSTLNNAKMKHVWLQTSTLLGMDLGALRLCVCNYVGEISKRIPKLFQWFPTVIKSQSQRQRKKVTSLFAKPLRQKAPHFSAQKLWELKMGPHSSKKEALASVKICLRLLKSQHNLMA